MKAGKVIVGIMAGAAVGAALGVLYAPDKGSKTRKKIMAQKDAYVSDLEDKFNGFVETVASRFESLKKDTAQKMDNGRTALHDGISKANDGLSKTNMTVK